MPDVTPFLSIGDFKSMFRALTLGEEKLAVKLLTVASNWVRDNTDRVPPDPMGELVVFEVVRDAMPAVAGTGQNMAGRTQYMLQTDNRMESATLSEAAALLDFTDHHKELLGISIAVMPSAGGFDSGFGGYR